LTVITDDALDTDALEAVVRSVCTAGRVVVQLRAKATGGAALLSTARRLAAVTHVSGSLLSVNDRIDVALACGAGGVHLPAAGMASGRARTLVGAGVLLGRSVHSLEEIDHERACGAVDYVQFGPVFATPSKAAFGPPHGLVRLSEAVKRAAPLAVVAVGGIDAGNAGDVMRAGAAGFAVIGAVMRAADPGETTRALLRALPLGAQQQ
jgi:thiamine-phosphate pyrophosphorylase